MHRLLESEGQNTVVQNSDFPIAVYTINSCIFRLNTYITHAIIYW